MSQIRFDASKLLHANGERDRFIHKLDITEEDDKELLSCRKLARRVIRRAFTEAHEILKDEFKNSNHRLAQNREFKAITPAFWTQGSRSYGTLNYPAHMPPQQIDLDDGVYLPMDMFEDEPIYSKEIFFQIVDKALVLLCEQQEWKFIGDKPTCARIQVNQYAHLDFPLYAMPRERFEELKSLNQITLDAVTESYQFSETASIDLDPKHVYLARRDEAHWIKSDPKLIEKWFKSEKEIHGHRLTRVCRYFKAWRDYTWENGGPASIVLMVCVAEIFDKSVSGFSRDCEAILAVSKELPRLLKQEILNPAVSMGEREVLFPRGHSQSEINNIAEEAQQLFKSIDWALKNAASSTEVVDNFTRSFGGRIPTRDDLVVPLSTVSAALSHPPKKQPFRKIPNTKSA